MITAVTIVFVMASCARPPVDPAPDMIPVNHNNFQEEITGCLGAAIVIFHNSQFWQSADMKRRIEWLAAEYRGRAKFAIFEWRLRDDPDRFKLEMLPTVILYRNGYEIDRIKGIPPGEKERREWNDDLELWFLVNALQLKGGEYSGDFTYFFNNGYTLNVGNY